ncbi:KRR1 interacting protein 1 subgroup [Lasiodiplodia theobromae]|uniref:Protein KRI1 n=1 Tax=Lasiodiplodia theobromae TaxID=45133 RepID=A0A5N5D6D1_9PEZI|nr:Ribosome biogenesis protein kri1 [Lasiodiplodia theobromae]KAB2572894.1 Protein KRI1 [Lasiodiplodia theobromae]KAF4535976.1 Ribosome biogenesis protein kri1 [Lasiodiplodia theobromae]KAF9636886.1 KRR1 interacting protein 1 subgroup [Lasiodiplodia theobromae]
MAKDKTLAEAGRPAKRAKLLDDDDASSVSGGEEVSFKINEEFARRFEYNKKREEKQRLEEKYGKNSKEADDDEDSSSSEDEDDDAMLATEALDAEISATLNAIRNKDPRVYDANAKFYSDWTPENLPTNEKKEKPITIRDYHRQNLMEGKITGDEDEDTPAVPYAQEQAALKKELASVAKADESDDEDEDDFLVAKDKPKKDKAAAPAAAAATSTKPKKIELDVENADKDPENFLSNFLSSRAWTLDTDKFAPLESEDEDDDRRADEFEFAYNMRFEDPATANEKLQTFARDAVAKTSVRREEKSARQKQRDKERERKEALKREKEEDKARLRKLKIEEMEEKLNMIKEAAGLSGKEFNLDDWRDVLDADWDDDRWDQEMQKRFGDGYYAEKEGAASDSDDDGEGKKKKKNKKPKKPTWDDDIDIKDIIPDFEDDEEAPAFTLSGDEDEEDGGVQLPNDNAEGSDEETVSKKKKKSKKDEIDAKRAARRERRIIESLVDQNIDVELAAKQTENAPARFRYRETSPTTFGLTARDILLADDAQLNQFAGLKKMASWRDPEKKKKDKKKLGKKARLREWRKETFGDEEGPKYGFGDYVSKKYRDHGLPIQAPADVKMKDARDDGVDIREGSKKKKRGKKRKVGIVEE